MEFFESSPEVTEREMEEHNGKSRIKTPGQEPEEGTGKDQQGIKECGFPEFQLPPAPLKTTNLSNC